MTGWQRISGGWALNLDGTDASSVFTLPRLEVRASPQGWRSECLLANGRRAVLAPPWLGAAAAVRLQAVHLAAPLLAAARRPPPGDEP